MATMSTIFTLLMAILGGSLRMLSVCVPLSASFVVRGCQSSVLVTSRLGLVKVESDFERCLNLELPESLTLSLLERSDISAASTLALECFYQPRLKINFDEFVVDSWEYSFWKKCLQTYNTVDGEENVELCDAAAENEEEDITSFVLGDEEEQEEEQMDAV